MLCDSVVVVALVVFCACTYSTGANLLENFDFKHFVFRSSTKTKGGFGSSSSNESVSNKKRPIAQKAGQRGKTNSNTAGAGQQLSSAGSRSSVKVVGITTSKDSFNKRCAKRRLKKSERRTSNASASSKASKNSDSDASESGISDDELHEENEQAKEAPPAAECLAPCSKTVKKSECLAPCASSQAIKQIRQPTPSLASSSNPSSNPQKPRCPVCGLAHDRICPGSYEKVYPSSASLCQSGPLGQSQAPVCPSAPKVEPPVCPGAPKEQPTGFPGQLKQTEEPKCPSSCNSNKDHRPGQGWPYQGLGPGPNAYQGPGAFPGQYQGQGIIPGQYNAPGGFPGSFPGQYQGPGMFPCPPCYGGGQQLGPGFQGTLVPYQGQGQYQGGALPPGTGIGAAVKAEKISSGSETDRSHKHRRKKGRRHSSSSSSGSESEYEKSPKKKKKKRWWSSKKRDTSDSEAEEEKPKKSSSDRQSNRRNSNGSIRSQNKKKHGKYSARSNAEDSDSETLVCTGKIGGDDSDELSIKCKGSWFRRNGQNKRGLPARSMCPGVAPPSCPALPPGMPCPPRPTIIQAPPSPLPPPVHPPPLPRRCSPGCTPKPRPKKYSYCTNTNDSDSSSDEDDATVCECEVVCYKKEKKKKKRKGKGQDEKAGGCCKCKKHKK
ncbi:hypothetical protein JYU34_014982 [Plutella xylostella]|uniref:Uncharacterized protein n=1 Tax=Plutella xylostella TaxID=51655 RepID=A0ABQ7Q6D3_PLUXY|nr:hypothetical protein JYU34_014982 [Plutella xylostella]